MTLKDLIADARRELLLLINTDEECAQNASFAEWGKAYLPQLLDAVERMQWQPIETAPKDGTTILITDTWYFNPDMETPHDVLRAAYFDELENCWVEHESDEILDDDGPSYWRPMIELPTREALNPKEGK